MSRLLNFYDANGNPIEYHSLAEQIAFVDDDLHCHNVAEALIALKSYIPDNPEPGEYPDLTQLIAKIDTLQATLNGALSTNAEFVGYGTFQDAYNATLESNMSEIMFSWMLDDVDDKGRRVRKIIYHVGNGEFIDAIGSRIFGELEGVTIVTKGAASIKIGNTTIPLISGVNNFTVSSNSLVRGSDTYNCLTDGNIADISFVSGKDNILDVDFGDIPVKGSNIFYGGDFTNLRAVRRMNVYGNINKCFYDNTNVQYIQMYSESELALSSTEKVFYNTLNLKVLDISGLQATFKNLTSFFRNCGALIYDVRGFNLKAMHGQSGTTVIDVQNAFSDSAVNTIIFDENFVIQKGDYGSVKKNASGTNTTTHITISTPGRLTLVCLSETPPVPVDTSKIWEWIPSNCTLRVPSGCTQTYLDTWTFLQNMPYVDIQEFENGEYDL